LAARVRKARSSLLPPFPLDVEVVMDVGATLLAAGFAAADSYMAELRLAHIEKGYPTSEALGRCFSQCKLSLLRAKGPVTKATELKLEDIPAAARLGRAYDAYVVAVRFLLREIELAQLTWSAIVVPPGFGLSMWVVTLRLPVSKTDSMGRGASVTLHCTCEAPALAGAIGCAAHTVARLAAQATLAGARPEDWVFPGADGEALTKVETVALWTSLAPAGHPALGGHSPRRSGAKAYARAGWAVPSIQGVGRWAGATVLEYAEEALGELPRGHDGLAIPPGGTPALRTGPSQAVVPACSGQANLALEPLTDRVRVVEAALTKVRKKLEVEYPCSVPGAGQAPKVSLQVPQHPFVLNEFTNTLHAVASTVEGEQPVASTCSWAFASAGFAYKFVSWDEAPAYASLACQRCPATKPLRFSSALFGAVDGRACGRCDEFGVLSDIA